MKTLKHKNIKNIGGYLSWKELTINGFSNSNISEMYENGFVFTRLGKGAMNQTRSARINLSQFEPSSENRRILKKTKNITLNTIKLPHSDYDWRIHKLGHDFYEKKFGKKTFSANKIKELLTNKESNFNLLLEYSVNNNPVGYCICFENRNWLHYSYPFYDLESDIPNLGIGMMAKAIVWAKENGKKFVCLGSAQNQKALYKTQFSGFEWFDGKEWQTDVEELKKILKKL